MAALAVCAVFAALEGLFSGKGAAQKLAALNQPRWALPFWAWIIVGAVYYAVCFYVLSILFAAKFARPTTQAATAILLIVMSVNAFSNLLFFGKGDFRGYHLLMYPYAVAVAALGALMISVSPSAALGVGAYGVYLIYALAWTRAIWRLNPQTGAESPNRR